MKISITILLTVVALVALSFVGLKVFDYVVTDRPLQNVLKADTRNQSVKASAHFDGWFSTSTLVFDVTDVSGASRADVFRSFLQYTEVMQNRHFTTVILSCRGTNKFTLDGDYFQQLGQEYSTQNPIYTMRTFPTHVTAMDGTQPYSEYSGGIFAVLQKEMEQFINLNDEWYAKDLEVTL